MTEALVYKLSWRGSKTTQGYFEWDEADKLFQLRASLVGAAGQILWDAGKQSTVGRIVALLKARFGSENQAELFRAELRSRKRTKDRVVAKTLSRCQSADVAGVPRRVICLIGHRRNGVDMYLALRLNGKVVYGLLDTECDTSVVS